MLELCYDATPNAWKISILLEECGLPYRLRRIDLAAGEQFSESFLALNPNGRIPVLIDYDWSADATRPLVVFESGAILLYLADRTGRFIPADLAGRQSVIQWLMWQMSALGPTLGQNGHFLLYAPEKLDYAIDRFGREVARLYGVLDRQLSMTGAYLAGADYSIADIACFPWVMTHKRQGVTLNDFPAVHRWFADLRQRRAVQKGLAAAGGPGAAQSTE